jgi:catechol 2,3-dioxygenase-like lactoylglutathione lyase family enzyme
MIKQANYLGIVVNELEKATAFYRDTLGLAVDEAESIPGFYTQFKLDGGAILSLQANTEIPNGAPYEPALLVDNVDATFADWRQKGVDLLEEPNDKPFGRTFLFRTPDGHVLRAYQRPTNS